MLQNNMFHKEKTVLCTSNVSTTLIDYNYATTNLFLVYIHPLLLLPGLWVLQNLGIWLLLNISM